MKQSLPHRFPFQFRVRVQSPGKTAEAEASLFLSATSRTRIMARFSSRSSSSSRYYGARAAYNPSNGKRSPNAYDEVAVRYPNGVSTVIHHSNFRASSIARNKANDLCKMALRAAVEVSLFCGPDWELGLYKRILSEDCGIEVDVGSSENDSRSAQD